MELRQATKRIPGIDLVKIIAMVMVVTMHACGYYTYVAHPCFAFYLYDLTQPAIPLFFMTSGYILLARPVSEATFGYSLRKVWHIVRFIAVFTAVIYGLWYLFGDPDITYAKAVLTVPVGGMPFFYLWFLLSLGILYLLYPLLSRLWHMRHGRGIMSAVALLLITGGFAANLCIRSDHHVMQFLRLWYWIGYFLLGGAMHNFVMSLRTSLAVLLLAAAANTCALQWLHSYTLVTAHEYFYGSPLLIVYAVALFRVCLELPLGRRSWIEAGAGLFMPVFVLHVFVLTWLFLEFPWTLPGAAVGLTAATLGITLAISWLLTRIPALRRFFSL